MSTEATVQEATIIIRGADYCGAVTDAGEWLYLSPLQFASSYDAKHFKRWDRVRFAATTKPRDKRPEMRLVIDRSMVILRESRPDEQIALTQKLLQTGFSQAKEQGLTLILLQPRSAKLVVEKKAPSDAKKSAFSYRFLYQYSCDDGDFSAPYNDSEMDAMLLNLSKSYGEAQTVARILQVYGKEYPQRGMLMVMSREDTKRSNWFINGVIIPDQSLGRVDLGSLDLVC